ncbi:MAG: hypothetical protein ABGX41_09510 [Pseudohongiella sp.]|jgi:hypothetical protein
MEDIANYGLIWFIYLLASAAFFVVYWQITRFTTAIWSSYVLRALALAIVLTPWYANSGSPALAPALMVLLLDIITIGSEEALRTMVPLFLSVITAIIAATVLSLVKRNKRNKINKIQ